MVVVVVVHTVIPVLDDNMKNDETLPDTAGLILIWWSLLILGSRG